MEKQKAKTSMKKEHFEKSCAAPKKVAPFNTTKISEHGKVSSFRERYEPTVLYSNNHSNHYANGPRVALFKNGPFNLTSVVRQKLLRVVHSFLSQKRAYYPCNFCFPDKYSNRWVKFPFSPLAKKVSDI